MTRLPLALRIALVALFGIVAVQFIGLVLLFWDRLGGDRLGQGLARQIVATVELLETGDVEPWVAVRAVSNPLIRVALTPTATPRRLTDLRNADGPFADLLMYRLEPLQPREIQIRRAAWEWRARNDHTREDDGERGGWRERRPLPLRERLVVSVQLQDGNWLHFQVAAGGLAVAASVRAAVISFLTLVVVGVVLIWASRRVAGPITRFAAAADRLGVDLNAPPLAEDGGRELREAARAFNRMQARLKRLIDDRNMMLAAISHDVKTGLTRLRLRLESLPEESQRAKASDDVEEMEAMLASALALARDEIANEPMRPVELMSLLRDLAEPADGAGSAVDVSGPRRCVVQGRPTALRRLFLNLLTNASHYAHGAHIDVGTPADDLVHIDVVDDGPGVPETVLDRLFEPFFRLESSRSRATGGAGLGLAIVRSLARDHGGDAVALNRPEGGLIIRVSLPVTERLAPPNQPG